MINMYAGNLPDDMDTKELFDLFNNYGWVDSIFIVDDPGTKKSKGFGFVQMPEEDAQRAIKALNNKKVRGRKLKIEKAKPKEDNKNQSGY